MSLNWGRDNKKGGGNIRYINIGYTTWVSQTGYTVCGARRCVDEKYARDLALGAFGS